MKKEIKIATIGGGSSYTPELIEGFIKRKDRLPIKEIWLVDIPEGEKKLKIVGELAKRMVKKANLDWEIILTMDRKRALKNADFVTTQFRVGLLDARIRDESIPAKYGLLGQETNGAGGIFKAFRTIPVILDITKEMKELCPDAWLINFTNPSGMITETAIKVGGWEKTIGLCNNPIVATMLNYEVCGCAVEENKLFEGKLFTKFAGINHFHWHRVWNEGGKEITRDLIDLLYNENNTVMKEQAEKYGKSRIHGIEYNFEQLRDLGILPNGYHRYYYIEKDMLEKSLIAYNNHETRGQIVKKIEQELFDQYKNQDLDTKPEQLSQRGGAHYSDAACEVIASIYGDSRTMMVVNTQNNGAIDDLPYDSIIEITSLITSHGAEPLNWGKFENPAARGMLQLMKAMEETVIEAAVHGDYDKALHAFTINPLIRSGYYLKDLLKEMLIANKEFLPQFSDVIKKLEEERLECTE